MTDADAPVPESLRRMASQLGARVPEAMRAVFRPGSVTGDVWTLVSKFTSADERAAARQRLATGKYLSPYFADPRVRRKIGRAFVRSLGSEKTREWIRSEVLPKAIDLALDLKEKPRRIRLGKRWVKDERGRAQPIQPTDLLLGEFARYVLQETKKVAGDLLLFGDERVVGSDAFDGPSERLVYDDPSDRGAAPEPEADEACGRRRANLARFMKALPLALRERELLRHLQSGVSPRRAAELMGVRPVTVRVWLHRMKKKYQETAH
jgi:DNA-directed RNA polymerase specialized sigma24 family protein